MKIGLIVCGVLLMLIGLAMLGFDLYMAATGRAEMTFVRLVVHLSNGFILAPFFELIVMYLGAGLCLVADHKPRQ
jgi:hypothetical protein